MMPVDHLKHSTWFSLALAVVIDLPTAAIAFVSSLLVDIDHWLWNIWAFGHWSPFKAIRWHLEAYEDKSCQNYHTCCVFHTVEFLVVLGAVAIVSPFARGVFLGVLFHVLCDLVDHVFFSPDMALAFRVKYLLAPFIPKLARGEVYLWGKETAVGPR
ncbi:hypothetical protein MYX19_05300 [Nitrospinae bacterium AH-259-F20]|nr:hypothetical protein [Nitrospinae bacterium AH-259-F20]